LAVVAIARIVVGSPVAAVLGAAEVDTGYSAVVAVASLHNSDSWVIVAQGSPLFLLRLSTFITLGEMRNMRKITTTSDRWQQSGSK